jgi:hypothetical protein
MKLIFEHFVEPTDVKTEDSGQAKIIQVDDNDLPVFVRLQSWDESTKHPLFNRIIGKRVRVTVETF